LTLAFDMPDDHKKKVEQPLEEKFRRMIETANEGIVASDADFVITFINSKISEMLGYSSDEILGRSMIEFIFPEDQTEIRDRIERRRQGQKEQYELKLRHKDGSPRWFKISATPQQDASGRYLGSFAMLTDITEQKHTVEALAQSEEKLRGLFETIPMGVVYLNQKGEIISANPAAQNILGLNLDQLLGRTSIDPGWRFILEDGSVSPYQSFTAFLEQTGSGGMRGAVVGLFNPNEKETYWVKVDAFPLFHPGEDQPYQFYVVFEDITASKQARLSEQSLYQGLKTINNAAMQLISLTDEPAIYQTICDVTHSLLPDAYLVVSALEVEQRRIYIAAHHGFEKQMKMIQKIIHRDPLQIQFSTADADDERLQPFLNGKLVSVEQGLYFLVSETIPLKAFNDIEKILGIGEVYHIGFIWANTYYGGLSILMPVGKAVEYSQVIETIVHLASIAIQRLRAKQALREKEDHYHQLFELESDAIFLIDNESGKILEANTAASQLYGYSHDELLAKKNTDLSAEPEETQNVTRSSPVVVDNLVNVPLRYHLKKDGTVFPVEITGRFFLHNGRPSHIAAIRDISQRLQAENELRKAQSILEEAQSIAHIGSYEYIEAGKKLTFSPELTRIYGQDLPKTANYGDYFACIYPDDQAHVKMAIETAKAGNGTMKVEYRIKRPDGTIRYVLERRRIYYDEEGKATRHVGTVQDITTSKEAQEALRESEVRFRALIESAPDAVLVVTDGKFVYLNPAALELFGAAAADELIGLPAIQRFHASVHNAIREHVQKVSEGTLQLPPEEEICMKMDGSLIHVEASAVPIQYLGRRSMLLFVRDITRRKNLERTLVEREKLAGIGTLAAGIAHEINTPLQIITGISETAQRKLEASDEVNREDLMRRFKMINSNAWRIASIVRSLLDYARSSAEKVESCQINDLVNKTLLLVEHQLKSWSNVSVETRLADELPSVQCDPNRIIQVLINLINNARDAMPHGGVITIQTEYDEVARSVLLRVVDTGGGIPAEIRDKIFDPFFTTKPIGEGSGLGLSTNVGILKAHGGMIELENTSETGSVFKVTIPVNPPSIHDSSESLGRY